MPIIRTFLNVDEQEPIPGGPVAVATMIGAASALNRESQPLLDRRRALHTAEPPLLLYEIARHHLTGGARCTYRSHIS